MVGKGWDIAQSLDPSPTIPPPTSPGHSFRAECLHWEPCANHKQGPRGVSLIDLGEDDKETPGAVALSSPLTAKGNIFIQTHHGARDSGPSVPRVGERLGYLPGPPQVATAPSVGIKPQMSQLMEGRHQ